MIISERREKILRMVAELGFVTVDVLGSTLGASQMTVRRDLQHLEDQGLLRRTHGGAAAGSPSGDSGHDERTAQALPAKRAIGRRAADLIKDGQTIFLDAGTTAVEVARQLKGRRRVTVITPSLSVIDALLHDPNVRVIATGGTIRSSQLVMIGGPAEAMLTERRADVAFISAAGFSVEDGATDYEDAEVAVKRAMIRNAKVIYLIVDSTKIGRITPLVVTDAHRFSAIITDDGITPEQVGLIREAGVEVIVAVPILDLGTPGTLLHDPRQPTNGHAT